MPATESLAENYSRAPIIEAVIGINFASALDEEKIRAAITKLKRHYPHIQTIKNLRVSIRLDGADPSSPDVEPIVGYKLSTDDQTQVIVLSPVLFTFSQLPPYPGWEHFIQRFERDWNVLKRIWGFREIVRIGVRYINRIDIPIMEQRGQAESVVAYENYINIYPKIPESVEPLDAFSLQTQSYLRDVDCNLKVNSASVLSPLLNHASFLIDLDISRERTPPQKDEDIVALLHAIRLQKNAIFESCISDQTRAMIR